MANIVELKGNIFDSSSQVIVNTVNCAGVMGRGIAFEFKHRFPEMFRAYKNVCEQGLLIPGKLLLWTQSNPWILNFPTKNHWKYPSKLAYIDAGLKKFISTYSQKQISSISFPLLGTSHGGLLWEDVRTLMYKYLEEAPNLVVEIYHFDASAEDTLFTQLFEKTRNVEPVEFGRTNNISAKQADIIIDATHSGRCKRMMDFAELNGIGPVALDKIFNFAKGNDQSVTADVDAQLRLL